MGEVEGNCTFNCVENRRLLGNAEKPFQNFFLTLPTFKASFRWEHKEKTNKYIWHFTRFSLSLHLFLK